MTSKIKNLTELLSALAVHKQQGRKIVFTNGCYDLIHVGHIRCFKGGKKLGDIMVVAVNSDRSVRALKGPRRPIVPQEERAEILAALECVDYVTIFDQDTPREIISLLKPNRVRFSLNPLTAPPVGSYTHTWRCRYIPERVGPIRL